MNKLMFTYGLLGKGITPTGNFLERKMLRLDSMGPEYKSWTNSADFFAAATASVRFYTLIYGSLESKAGLLVMPFSPVSSSLTF